jgi:uncharacterized membrane protein
MTHSHSLCVFGETYCGETYSGETYSGETYSGETYSGETQALQRMRPRFYFPLLLSPFTFPFYFPLLFSLLDDLPNLLKL